MRDALNSKRKNPRKDGRGISNITVDQKLRLTLEQQQIYQRAMEKVAAVAKEARSTGGLLGDEEVHRISPEEAMTFLCQRILETDDLLGSAFPPRSPRGDGCREGSERDRAIYDLTFRTCPDCHASHILTDDGPVEVPHDHVKAIEKKARKVELKAEELMKGEILPRGMINDLAIPKLCPPPSFPPRGRWCSWISRGLEGGRRKCQIRIGYGNGYWYGYEYSGSGAKA